MDYPFWAGFNHPSEEKKDDGYIILTHTMNRKGISTMLHCRICQEMPDVMKQK